MRPTPESCRHDLGRKKWQLSSAGQGARSICRMARARLDQGLPLSTSVLPHSGIRNNGESVRSLLAGRKRQARWLQASRRRSPRADPFGQSCRREPKLMSFRNARLKVSRG